MRAREQETSQDKLVLVSGGNQNASLLTGSNSTAGIADFSNDFASEMESDEMEPEAEGNLSNKQASGVGIEVGKKAKRFVSNGKQNSRSKLLSRANTLQANTTHVSEPGDAKISNNDDLDMTGWDANYDLPR